MQINNQNNQKIIIFVISTKNPLSYHMSPVYLVFHTSNSEIDLKNVFEIYTSDLLHKISMF